MNSKLSYPLPGHAAHARMMNQERFLLNAQPNRSTKKSAVLMVFYPDEDNVMFPLILRPKYDGTHGGQMALPGGKMENIDENLTRTALREAQEEIGIKAIDVNIIGLLTEVYIPVSNYIVQPVVGFLNYKPTFYPDHKEVDEIVTIKFEEFLKKENMGTKNMLLGNQNVSMPGYTVNNKWIWGATALIINEFLEAIS